MPQPGMLSDKLVIQAQCAETEEQRRIFFGELVPHFQRMAYGYAYAILGDTQLAEDAVQEGFLTAYQLLAQLREPQAFTAWFRRILFTHCRRLLKQERFVTQSLEHSVELRDEQFSPQISLERAELRRVVGENIAALPPSQQDPVALYYLNDYSQREIAAALNLSVDAVKKRLERARLQLEERMRDMAQEYLHTSAAEQGGVGGLFATLMDAAAVEGQYTLLETLLVEGMAVDEQDANGQTALHWAASAGNFEAVELLLRYHADVACRDHTGRTALQLAVESRYTTLATRLRHASAPQA